MKFLNIVLFTISFLSIEIYASGVFILDSSKLKEYVEQFNADDEELYANISNKDAFSFLKSNIPKGLEPSTFGSAGPESEFTSF